jgi:hypothetical protein
MEGIRGSRVLVLILSRAANDSAHIVREVERAIHLGIPVVPFRIEDVAPSGGLEYHLGTLHWLDAMTPPLRAHMRPLAETIRAILGKSPQSPAAERRTFSRRSIHAVAGAVLLMALGTGYWALRMSPGRSIHAEALTVTSGAAPAVISRDSSTGIVGHSQTVPPSPPSAGGRERHSRVAGAATATTDGLVGNRAVAEKVVGEYDNGARIEVVTLGSDGRLSYFLPGEPLDELRWERDWRFRRSNFPDVSVEFVRGRDGVVTALIGHLPNNVRVTVPRRFGKAPPRAVLDSLTGEYGGDPPALVTLEQGELQFAFPGFPVFPLRFANGLHFAVKGHGGLSIEFVRGVEGDIAYLLVHQPSGDVSIPRKRP